MSPLPAGSTLAQTTANGPYYATPSWDQTLPASTRFIVLSNGSWLSPNGGVGLFSKDFPGIRAWCGVTDQG